MTRNWNIYEVERVLLPQRINSTAQSLRGWLAGDFYPSLKSMRRIEKILGWRVADQIAAMPYEGVNPVYGLLLRERINHHDWDLERATNPDLQDPGREV
jgi:hypothetical protein